MVAKKDERFCYLCLGIVAALFVLRSIVCALSMAAIAACEAIDNAVVSMLYRAAYPCDRRLAKRRASGIDSRK